MPMFHWNVTPGDTVSGLFWVYWVVTVPLTLAVVGGWLLWDNDGLLSNIGSLFRKKQDKSDLEGYH